METTAPPRAGRREWTGLAVLTLPALLIVMDLTVLHLAVPELSADLEPSAAQLLWITDIYGFMIAGFLVTMGTLGDRIGRRRLLLIGAAAFGIASVLAAYSTSAGMLIACRAMLGVAGATLMPSTLSLIRTMFHDPRQRTVAISVWMTSFMVGASIGPLVGGVLLEYFWWGAAFLPGVPVMVLLVAAGPALLPEYRDPAAGRLDLPSAVLSLATVLPVVYGIKGVAADGPGPLPALTIAAGLFVGVVFVRRQRRLADPFIDVRLFGNPAFSASLAALTLGAFVMMGINLLIMQHLQLVLGLSPFRAGLWAVPATAGAMVTMLASPALVRRVRPGYVIGAGLVVAAVGLALLTLVDTATGPALVVTGFVLLFAGMSPVGALGTDMIVGAAPPARAGAASAISETSQEFGGAFGLAVLGSVGTAVYRADVTGAVPAGVPADAARAARDTLGGAMAAAERLPGPLGADLLDAARAAFTHGLRLTAAISVVLVLAAAVGTMIVLRNVKPSMPDNPDESQTKPQILEPEGRRQAS